MREVESQKLKGRFAQWYNRGHDRYGVLWADRFKSVLLEAGEALATVAAYIELNPVRAGLCADPKDYRYCGYAEALAKGSSLAWQGISTVLGQPETVSCNEVSRQYRQLLFRRGSLQTQTRQPLFDPATAQCVVEQQNGELSLAARFRVSDSLFHGWRHPRKSGLCRIALLQAQGETWLQTPARRHAAHSIGLF